MSRVAGVMTGQAVRGGIGWAWASGIGGANGAERSAALVEASFLVMGGLVARA